MGLLDFIIVIILGIFAGRGAILGIKRSFASFTALLLAFTAAIVFCFDAGDILARFFPVGNGALFAGYLTILVLISALTRFLEWMIGRTLKSKSPSAGERISGTFVGILEGAVFTLALSGLIFFLPLPFAEHPLIESSFFIGLIRKIIPIFP